MAHTDVEDASASLEPFVFWLDRHGEARFAQLAERLCAEIPQLGCEAENVAALRSAIVSHLPTLRSGFKGLDSTPTLPRPARDFARTMARSDTPLSAVLRSYELGQAALWESFTEYLRSRTDWSVARRAETLEVGSIRLFKYMQTMTSHTIDEYNAVRDTMARMVSPRRNEIVQAVLSGTEEAPDLERILGYELGTVHVGYVAVIEEGVHTDVEELVRREISAHARQHLTMAVNSTAVHGWFTPKDRFGYDRASAPTRGRPFRLNLGSPRRGVNGFRETHHEAMLVAELAYSEPSSTARFSDVAVSVLATRDSALARRFLDDQLGPLLAHEDADRLVTTLRHYLDTLGSPTHCGRALGVHPNTVTQRLQRAEEILGREIDSTSLPLRVALHLASPPCGPKRFV